MAGYHLYSLDPAVFEQLTAAPTKEQGLVLAGWVCDELKGMLDEYDGNSAAEPAKWPLGRAALADSIRKRLASPDWYADLTRGDARIWHAVLRGLDDRPGEKIGIDFRCENDVLLYWGAARATARHGAPMMAEHQFGNGGYRYFGRSRGEIDLMYTIYLPAQARPLLGQLEKAVPHFEALPDEEGGDRDQFFRGLFEPVRRIVDAGRVLWVQTDT